MERFVIIKYDVTILWFQSISLIRPLFLKNSDPTDELLMIIGIFTHFFALETTLAERQFFRALARLVGRRAARLSACGIAAIVTKKGYLEEGCMVGADGSLYNVCCIWQLCTSSTANFLLQKYPGFADRVHEGLVDIFGDKGRWVLLSYVYMIQHLLNLNKITRNIVTHHAEDGSGVGSAIIAGKILNENTICPFFFLLTNAHLAMTKQRKDAGLFLHV